MEKIIDTLLQDSSICEKLEFEAQKKLLRAQAIKIAEISAQDVERLYTGSYRKVLNKLSELNIQ